MTQDQLTVEPHGDEAPPRPRGPGALVFGGIVVACAAGVGLGLWARPTGPARAAETPAEIAQAAPAALEVVIDDAPAPIGPLLEVLPDRDAGTIASPAPDVIVPHRAASGLVKVDAPVSAALIAPSAVAPAAQREVALEVAPPKIRKADADEAAARKAALAKARLADARAAEARAKKAEIAAREAKAEKARAVKLAQAEKARKAKAETVRLAELEARKEAAAREKRRLANLAKAAPGKPKAEVGQFADARPKASKTARPAAKTTLPSRVETARRAPAPKRVTPHGEGPVRVARADPCASRDAGEAAVCADPRLSARERQLQQAYRNAEAAGVPASALRAQQARWAQARAAAAREAPWAVEDVYIARISELKDQTRDAREN
ncbi:hypothetical protein [Phenylobacterium sp.]|uniref:hypothetical protein n=1 Tax=Phenylobacterium sp. TaxID=1871053 RepID=UPI0025F79D2E|nr:hypothetical protein [Phenylobacterium sp.]MBX3483923.1 hypothetical protein [Phenylobacterium sp.]